MAAFHRAVELGATFIETDLHLSRDAHLVCVHDATLERTTNANAAVKDLRRFVVDAEELRVINKDSLSALISGADWK